MATARLWIFIVLSYYFIVASYNIFPDIATLEVPNQVLMVVQMAMAILIFLTNVSTYWLPMWPIKFLLVIQSF